MWAPKFMRKYTFHLQGNNPLLRCRGRQYIPNKVQKATSKLHRVVMQKSTLSASTAVQTESPKLLCYVLQSYTNSKRPKVNKFFRNHWPLKAKAVRFFETSELDYSRRQIYFPEERNLHMQYIWSFLLTHRLIDTTNFAWNRPVCCENIWERTSFPNWSMPFYIFLQTRPTCTQWT
jgi:hypothetical protein